MGEQWENRSVFCFFFTLHFCWPHWLAPRREWKASSAYCASWLQRNRISATLHVMWGNKFTVDNVVLSQEKWIHFHFPGLPLKLLREDNYFPSSKYFLTSFSWKWQSGSAPGWEIQPWLDECNFEHSPWFSVSFRGLEFSFAKWIVMYFWQILFSFNFKTRRSIEVVPKLFPTAKKTAWKSR